VLGGAGAQQRVARSRGHLGVVAGRDTVHVDHARLEQLDRRTEDAGGDELGAERALAAGGSVSTGRAGT
jgi:hypothetical protein